MVIGDALLDVDVEGTADRLCPEAPVPVVDVAREWRRPGGAGLAAVLAARTAAQVTLVTALADDAAGASLTRLLSRDVEIARMPLSGATVAKRRVRAGGQSLLRMDSGDGLAAESPLPGPVRDAIRSAGAILVADYGRGVAQHPEVRRLLTTTTAPVVWDPHPRGSSPLPGSRLVTPNVAEARHFAPGHAEPEELAKLLRAEWSADALAVTAGSRGAVFADEAGVSTIPVPRGIRALDTCGAGDRFASAAAAALLDGASTREAVTVAVTAAARFVAAGGAAAVSTCDTREAPVSVDGTAFGLAESVRRDGGRLVATGGCFDLLHPGHLSLLRQARALGDALIVCLNSDESVRGLKGAGRPIVPARDRARMLLELSSVDAVAVFDEPSPVRVLRRLRPDIWVKGGDYAGTHLPERDHVGEVVLVPLVGGYSTTKLINH
ncbi:rfaE bifunctional protein, domain I/rfaE bifunctional protein, domain II [Amycolatopsis xylanica]|uniref:RfaE bifunctional protein, domain I/rfaE bifunctional protein, domain II n=1 Tax=Amycolatopsis xylanica TaxID=589385 RepID=A0A1H3S9T4_9PSEU|nr:rfaE bifunctional protein, domain I/rfaE bifunctional protein, domain II [Amycolatopsis xylanica]